MAFDAPPLTFSLPRKEGAVILAVLATVPFLLLWQTLIIGNRRKVAGIKYPQHYATPEECKASHQAQRLNCALRANANTLEVLPIFVISLLVSATDFPRLSAALGVVTVITMITYTTGYVSSEGIPGKRYRNPLTHLRWASIAGLSTLGAYTAGSAIGKELLSDFF